MSANNERHFSKRDLKSIAFRQWQAARAGIPAKQLRVCGGVLLLALSTSLVGQTHFCIGGDVDHLTPANIAACRATLPSIREAVRQRGISADWHFVVVCDEAGWKEYTSFSRMETGLLSGADYSTDTRLHWTFLRGSELQTGDPQAAADVLTMALDSLPRQKSSPAGAAPQNSTRQYGIAMAQHGRSNGTTQ